MEYLQIIADSDSKRADNYISEKTGRSRSYIASLIDSGDIKTNGKTLRKSSSLKSGDIIDIIFPPEEMPDITPKEIEFEIIYDGPRYAVINKPAGITVHPAPGNYDYSLVNGLLYTFNISDDSDVVRPGIVHRLDKDTSGLLLVAKDRDSREIISRLFHDRMIKKYYYAVALGIPNFKHIIIEAPIGRDKRHRKRMAVTDGGRFAKTSVKVMEVYKNSFLSDIELFTGRTHQIRVHMKHIKHPLIGDVLYGSKNASDMFHRQALHAYKLIFTDPFTGKDVVYSTGIPDDIKTLTEKLKN